MPGKKSTKASGYIGYVFRRGWGDVPEVVGRKSGEFDYATYEEVRAAVLKSEINDLCHIAERVLAVLGTSTHEEFRRLELGTGCPTRDWRRANEAAVRSAAAALLDSLRAAAPTSECWKEAWPVPRGLFPSPAPEPAGLRP